MRLNLAPSRVVFVILGGAVTDEQAMARLLAQVKNVERVLAIAFDAPVEVFSLLGVCWAFLRKMKGIFDPFAAARACPLVAWEPHVASNVIHQSHSVCCAESQLSFDTAAPIQGIRVALFHVVGHFNLPPLVSEFMELR